MLSKSNVEATELNDSVRKSSVLQVSEAKKNTIELDHEAYMEMPTHVPKTKNYKNFKNSVYYQKHSKTKKELARNFSKVVHNRKS